MGQLSENWQESLEKHSHIAYHTALKGHPYTQFVHELDVKTLHKV